MYSGCGYLSPCPFGERGSPKTNEYRLSASERDDGRTKTDRRWEQWCPGLDGRGAVARPRQLFAICVQRFDWDPSLARQRRLHTAQDGSVLSKLTSTLFDGGASTRTLRTKRRVQQLTVSNHGMHLLNVAYGVRPCPASTVALEETRALFALVFLFFFLDGITVEDWGTWVSRPIGSFGLSGTRCQHQVVVAAIAV